MKNIFVFIRRYFNFLFFVVLQILSITLLVKYNDTHEAVYAVVANEVTGSVNKQYDKVHNFFLLGESNRLLQEENARLRNMLSTNFENPDTSRVSSIDSTIRDTSGRQRKYIWLTAKVVLNTVFLQNNYITLHRGSLQGVKKDMAVIGPQGAVGTVIDVTENYSKVMSLLNRNSKVSAMLKKSKTVGTVEWDGKEPNYLTLRNIPKSTPVVKGDSVVTSNYSGIPSNIMVGIVHDVVKDPSSNFYVITLKSATNFYTLEYVYLVENVQWEEQRRLEAAPVKNQ